MHGLQICKCYFMKSGQYDSLGVIPDNTIELGSTLGELK